MSMIKCPECEKEISNKSSSCVHCGFPIKTCSECGELILIGSKCLKCGYDEGEIKKEKENKEESEKKELKNQEKLNVEHNFQFKQRYIFLFVCIGIIPLLFLTAYYGKITIGERTVKINNYMGSKKVLKLKFRLRSFCTENDCKDYTVGESGIKLTSEEKKVGEKFDYAFEKTLPRIVYASWGIIILIILGLILVFAASNETLMKFMVRDYIFIWIFTIAELFITVNFFILLDRYFTNIALGVKSLGFEKIPVLKVIGVFPGIFLGGVILSGILFSVWKSKYWELKRF
jgi:hypothetical protein